MAGNEPAKSSKSVPFGIRGSVEVKELLKRLADMLSEDLGARVSMSKAFEVAIREAVASRESVASRSK